MSMDEIEVAKLRWETKELGRLENLPPWEQPDAPEEESPIEGKYDEDDDEFETDALPESEEDDEDLAIYLGGDCV